jgi:hypothetical protein
VEIKFEPNGAAPDFRGNVWKGRCLGSKIRLLSAGHFQPGEKGGEAVKIIQFIVIFVAGLGLGALAHARLTAPANNAYSEEKVQKMMLEFQNRLNELEKPLPANADELSKRVEAQGAILELITKYRDAEYAKYTPFTSLAGVLFAAILGALTPGLISKRKSETKPNP